MKPIMHLYSDKVTITDKKELLPLMKGSTVHVAASVEPRVIYTNVPRENLDKFIEEEIGNRPSLGLLKLAIATSEEVKTVPSLRIADDDTVSVEETLDTRVFMVNKVNTVVIVGVNGKLYTNNTLVAKKCVENDVENGELSAALLKISIDLKGLTECELQCE